VVVEDVTGLGAVAVWPVFRWVAVVVKDITELVAVVVEDITEVGAWWGRQLQMWQRGSRGR
jgi:hypothetical protein